MIRQDPGLRFIRAFHHVHAIALATEKLDPNELVIRNHATLPAFHFLVITVEPTALIWKHQIGNPRFHPCGLQLLGRGPRSAGTVGNREILYIWVFLVQPPANLGLFLLLVNNFHPFSYFAHVSNTASKITRHLDMGMRFQKGVQIPLGDWMVFHLAFSSFIFFTTALRSEERRVGKE